MARDDNILAEDVALERSLRGGLGYNAASADFEAVPIIDLGGGASDAELTEQLWQAATSVGFFTLTNHGIPAAEVEAMFGAAKAYFAQDRATKEEASPYAAHLNAGYEYMQQIRPSTGLPDVKESFQMTTRDDAMKGRWPSDAFEAQCRAFTEKAHALARRVLTLLEPKAAPDLPPGTLAAAHTIWTDESQCTTRMLHYPPLAEAPEPGSMRAGAHTDWTCVTLLFQLPGNEGLECAAHPRAGTTSNASTSSSPPAGWVPVDPVPGGVAVNIGDMLARWSDGRLLSNLHRVRMPNGAAEAARSRYSIAFFAQADKSQLMTVRDPETGALASITAGDYILGRIRSNFEAKFSATSRATDEKQEEGSSSSSSG